MSEVTLSAAVRQNLLALQQTSAIMGEVQNRLATGKKVNSALDNPNSFFTASGLNNRANDLAICSATWASPFKPSRLPIKD